MFSKGTFSPLSMIISLKEFTKYPLSLFNDGIVVLLTWIIPIAITSYYPTLLFVGDYSIIGYSASTSAFFVSGLILFREGLKRLDGMSS